MESQIETKKCPFCMEDIHAEAVKCKHCGEWLNKSTTKNDSKQTMQKYRNAQVPWHLILLSIITFDLYAIYWFYRNWKHMKKHFNLSISPGWRTIGLFVPILNLILMYKQFKDIRDFARNAGCRTYSSPGLLLIGYMVISYMSTVFALLESNYTEPQVLLAITLLGLLLSLLSALILFVVQNTLNALWERATRTSNKNRIYRWGNSHYCYMRYNMDFRSYWYFYS